jgi:hypothetical protein
LEREHALTNQKNRADGRRCILVSFANRASRANLTSLTSLTSRTGGSGGSISGSSGMRRGANSVKPPQKQEQGKAQRLTGRQHKPPQSSAHRRPKMALSHHISTRSSKH